MTSNLQIIGDCEKAREFMRRLTPEELERLLEEIRIGDASESLDGEAVMAELLAEAEADVEAARVAGLLKE